MQIQVLESFNWVDILLILFLIKTIYSGAKTGLTSELFKLIGTITSVVVGLHYYNEIANILGNYIKMPIGALQCIILAVIALLIAIIIKYVVILLLKILNIQFVKHLEKVGGALIGLARGFLIGGLFMIALAFLPVEYLNKSICEKSLLSGLFIQSTEKTYTSIISIIPSQKPKEIPITPLVEKTKPKPKSK